MQQQKASVQDTGNTLHSDSAVPQNQNLCESDWGLLIRLADSLRAKAFNELFGGKIKISLSKIRVLTYFFLHDGQKPIMKKLSADLNYSSGAISQIVDTLVADGLLKRIGSSTDLRSVYVGLTPKGLRAREQFIRYVNQKLQIGFEKIDPDAQKCFHQILSEITNKITTI